MYINGFISSDIDNWATIGGSTFASEMKSYAENHGMAYKHHNNLGGEKAIIPNCSVRMYFTKEEMTFLEAEQAFLDYFYGSDNYEMEANYVGYSEWSIEGYELTTCNLGGHNLNNILLSHIGEYVNICVE